MKDIRVLVDMDGVICDLIRHACGKFPYAGDWRDVYANWPRNNYDVHCVFDKTTPAEFWNALDRKFWATMPKTKHADWLINHLETIGYDYGFLSTPSSNPESASGKIEWIEKNYPEMRKRFLLGAAKDYCANGNSILIDDYTLNCISFEEAGGRAIIFPQPWNILNSCVKQTRSGIKNALERITNDICKTRRAKTSI